jgi:alkanesulfonate monooxygenase SsuD/methylene tetrahydromethanopterin reductase-like flavin-dependent oxidoreductase (luciferase family)
MKVFVEVTNFAATASQAQLRERISQIEDAGATGVSLWDHIYTSTGGRPCDPLTTLAAVAALSDRLEVQTVVMNSEWLHPGLLLRQFAQLAVWIGGERVTAGLGAGWNTEEFAAMGLKMAPYRERIERLEETLQIARQLFHTGEANFDGTYVSAHHLPVSPVPSSPPRLLVGGGSDRIMEIAGRYADVLDLHGTPKHAKLTGRTFAERHAQSYLAVGLTTVDDHVAHVQQVRAASRAAGRDEHAVKFSVQLQHVAFGGPSEMRTVEKQLCATWGLSPEHSLAENPYVLLGEPQQMADKLIERQERFGLDQIVVKEHPDPLDFCRRVLPLLPKRSMSLTVGP